MRRACSRAPDDLLNGSPRRRSRTRARYLHGDDGADAADRRGRRAAARRARPQPARRGLRRSRGGDRARAARARSAQPPDALVIDIGLPDADGRDLCQALRAQGRRRAGAVPDRARRADRSAQRFQRRRRRLRDQAVRHRGGGRAAARAAAARRHPIPRRRAVTGLALDPVAAGRLARRTHADADADRVPAAGRARGPARQGDLTPGADPHRMAARRDRAGQHARRVHRPDPPQARESCPRRRRSRRCTVSGTGCR